MKDVEDVCKNEYECNGNCWVNVAGNYKVWEVISNQCKGTLKEQILIEDVFNGKKDKQEIIDNYNFTAEEKEIVAGCWK